MYLAKLFQSAVLSKACLSCICYFFLDRVLGIFCVLFKISYWLWALTLNNFTFYDSRGSNDRSKCQEILFFPYFTPNTILKLLQSPNTQEIKYKKKTITTFRIPLTLSCPKSFQNPTDYMSFSCLFSINNMSLLPFSSRIFFILCWSFFCCWLVILNFLVTYQGKLQPQSQISKSHLRCYLSKYNWSDTINAYLQLMTYLSKSVTGILLALESKSHISIKVYLIQSGSRMFLFNNSVYNLILAYLTCLPRYFHEL